MYLTLNAERLVTIQELADFFGISKNHLVKVVQNLGLKGFVKTVRGKGGGLCLARPPQHINVGQVVREMEGHFYMAECFNPAKQGQCAIQGHCGLIGLLADAAEQFLHRLDQAVLSDLISETADLSIPKP